MKRFLSALVALALIMSCVAIPALADWSCSACGASNGGKFCTECGAKRPADQTCLGCGYTVDGAADYRFCPKCGLALGESPATPTPRPTSTPTPRKTPTPTPRKTPTPTPKRTFEITGATMDDVGNVTVRWQDSANRGPYTVRYMYYVNGDYFSDTQQEHLSWLAEESCYGKSYTMQYLVPGVWYWIMVSDAAGNTTRYAYRPSLPANFPDFTVKITMELRRAQGSEVSKISSFSAATIAANTKYSYGAYIRLDYSQLKRERHYVGRVSIAGPDGTVFYCGRWEDFSLPSGRSNTYWKMFTFDTAFENAERMHGYIPSGKWTWSLYFDDMFVNSYNFTVGK